MVEYEKNLNFWDHIEDLRKVLIRSGTVIFAGFIIALFLHQTIFHFLTHNWQNQSTNSIIEREFKHFQIHNPTPFPQLFEIPPNANVLIHQNSRKDEVNPHLYRIESQGSLDYEIISPKQLLFLSPMEGIILTFKVSFWISLALTSPLWGWIFFTFITPGMHSHEKKIIFPFLIGSIVGLGLAIATAYYFTIPLANQYFHVFNASLGQNAWSFAHYVDYTLIIILGHIVAFELCLLLLLLVHFRILSQEWLISKRRYMIILSLILAALLTPPDVVTQITLAVPLIIFYEIAILYGKWRLFTI
jgi:sec-independent protein translocase protein TatC